MVMMFAELLDFMSGGRGVVVPFMSVAVVIFTVGLIKRLYCNRKIKPEGKAVLITGCDSGFGHEFARRLDSRGFRVFATCLFPSGPGALELKKRCSSKLHLLHMDVTRDESVEKGFEYAKENLGSSELWAIVNNAGIVKGLSFEDCTQQDYEDCLNVNFLGLVRVTKTFLPMLKQSKGRIVNITSLNGEVPAPYLSPYASSKYAAVGFTDCIRQDLDASGVSVVSIEPELFKTGISSAENLRSLKDSALKNVEESLREKRAASLDKLIDFVTSISSAEVSLVADDLEAAVSLAHPSCTYKPRRNTFMRFIIFMYEIMPRRCQLLIVTKLALPFIYHYY